MRPIVKPTAVATADDPGGVLAEYKELTALFGGDRDENLAESGGSGLPYLKFFHPSSPNAQEVQEALGGGVSVGTPYVVDDGAFHNVSKAAFTLMGKAMPYGCVQDNKGEVIRTWKTPPNTIPVPVKGKDREEERDIWNAFSDRVQTVLGNNVVPERKRFGVDYRYNGKKIENAVYAMILLAPEKVDMAARLATINVKRSTQSKCINRHQDSVDTFKNPVKAATLGEAIGKVPPGLRVFSEWKIKTGSGANGPYAVIDARSKPITKTQMGAVGRWMQDEAAQEQRVAIEEQFEAWKTAILKDAV